ncbi:MAG: hypothetical protein K2Y37_12870 [Pirellulales bacterium]|nr:hypothetical protein [Pirellulales bacterium]
MARFAFAQRLGRVWLALVLVAVCVPAASAQVRSEMSPAQRNRVSRRAAAAQRTPSFSPYLNLLRNDTNPALNYFTLVRPQVRQDQTNRMRQAELDELQNEVQPQDLRQRGTPQRVRATGHASRYMDYQGYFGANRQSGS